MLGKVAGLLTKLINVTLTYKICVENSYGDLIITNPDRTWMSYDGPR